MVNHYHAYTAPINPAGASPQLTLEQCWQGLQIKIREPMAFVHTIAACNIIGEDKGEGATVEREITFKADGGKEKTWEACTSYKPLKVEFRRRDDSLVCNILSNGPSQAPHDLWLTYTFEWRGKDEATFEQFKADMTRVSKKAVDDSIEVMRNWVVEGRIK